ncbi:MAG TPA: Fe-S protein assembly co-chaperone HscB [Candidatus Binataceae bacterium]|nr:Fe-S protein assembly co-chaperone HscB [Candidatus Binataceae bacterium]
MIQCPSCGRRQGPRLICENCGAPLGAEVDGFAALTLPRKLVLDTSALERVYHDLSRQIHPDRFAQGSAQLRDASLRSTALLTRSYRTLRDPIARGLYWLELKGEKLADNNKTVPPELAELVFEVQDELSELREAGCDLPRLRKRTRTRRKELESAINSLQRDLARNFERWDAGGDPQQLSAELKAVLSKIAYLRTLVRDVDRELENLKAA